MDNKLLFLLNYSVFISPAFATFCNYSTSCTKYRYQRESYSVSCSFWYLGRCSRYRQRRIAFSETCQKSKCCHGYAGSDCSQALCDGSTTCPNGGSCISPNQCQCSPGFTGKDCKDINECLVRNGGCSQICTNLLGTYKCTCESGMEIGADGKSCKDIDECLLNHGGCSQKCVNEYRSYTCECDNGFQLGSDGKSCYDIDECVTSSSCPQICTNTIGSYLCSCRQGFLLATDGQSCDDDDDCIGIICENGGTCIDGLGTFTCDCLSGFEGMNCEHDTNECLFLNGGCADQCINEYGSYKCVCSNGTNLDGSCVGQNIGTNASGDQNFFQLHKIARKLLPKGCALLEIDTCDNRGKNDSLVLSSTSDWFKSSANNNIYFTFGVVFAEIGFVSLPVSISGVAVIHKEQSIELVFGAMTHSEETGQKLTNRLDDHCFSFPITPRDVHQLINSFMPTLFDRLHAVLPEWVRFTTSESSILSVADVKTDFIYGHDIGNVHECKDAPVQKSHLYNVFRFRSGFKMAIFENDLFVPAPLAGNKFCILVDFCQDNAGTFFLLIPPESRGLLQTFDIFKSLRMSTGIEIRPKGVGLSIPKYINVGSSNNDIEFWNGQNLFTYRVPTTANVWLGTGLWWSWQNDILNVSANGEADIFIGTPSLSALLTGIFVDEWNVLRRIKAGLAARLIFKLFGKDVRIVLKERTSFNSDAFVSVGGNVSRNWCGESANPEGVFLSLYAHADLFHDIPILEDWTIKATVQIYAFFTTTPNHLSPTRSTIDIFNDVVDFTAIIKHFKNVLAEFVTKFQNEMSIAIVNAISELRDAVQSFLVLVENSLKRQNLDLKECTRGIGKMWKVYVDSLKGAWQQVLDLTEFDQTLVAKHLEELIKNQTTLIHLKVNTIIETVRNQLFSVVEHRKGFGFKLSADINLFKLNFGLASFEFVYSVDELEQCSKFKEINELLKGETSAKVVATFTKSSRLGYFIEMREGYSMKIAIGLSTPKIVVHFNSFVRALGLSVSGDVFISDKRLVIYIEGNIWNVYYARLQFTAALGDSWYDLTFNVIGQLGVKRGKREVGWITKDNDFGGSYLDGLSILAKKAADAAGERLDNAKDILTSAQQGITNAQNAISDAQEKVASANSAFDRAVEAMDIAKENFEKAKGPFKIAMEKLTKAQKNLDRLCRIRTCSGICVPGVVLRWCKGGWWNIGYPCFRTTSCMFRLPDIGCHLANFGCSVVRAAAYVVLEAAKLFVRVPMLALDIAKAAVTAAQFIVDKSRVVLILANGVLEVAKIGLETVKGVLEVAKLALDAVK